MAPHASTQPTLTTSEIRIHLRQTLGESIGEKNGEMRVGMLGGRKTGSRAGLWCDLSVCNCPEHQGLVFQFPARNALSPHSADCRDVHFLCFFLDFGSQRVTRC